MSDLERLTIEDAHITMRNFAGERSQYNQDGKRTFLLIIPAENNNLIRRFKLDGYNIKQFKPRDDGHEPDYFVQVQVSYKYKPPSIYLLNGTTKVVIREDTVALLDSVDIDSVDLIIQPYRWETALGSGITAYLHSMYVKTIPNDLDKKYANYGE